MILTNENDIYIFFETIEQLEPESVLDIGMFLKRIGSVSRKIMNREIAESVRLDGVDFFPQVSFPVWDNVYDGIISVETFLDEDMPRRYGLAVLLGTRELQETTSHSGLLERAAKYADYVLTDRVLYIPKERTAEWSVTDLKVEEDIYYLIHFGD